MFIPTFGIHKFNMYTSELVIFSIFEKLTSNKSVFDFHIFILELLPEIIFPLTNVCSGCSGIKFV